MGRELKVSFDGVREKNVNSLRVLILSFFPIKYSDKVYQDACIFEDFSQLAYHTDVLVGGIACRCEKTEKAAKLYIMTIGVLPAYRGCGIGSKLLNKTLDACKKDSKIQEVRWAACDLSLELFRWRQC